MPVTIKPTSDETDFEFEGVTVTAEPSHTGNRIHVFLREEDGVLVLFSMTPDKIRSLGIILAQVSQFYRDQKGQ